MTAEAIYVRNEEDNRVVVDATIAGGEVYQLKDGRAAYNTALNAGASGDMCNFMTKGKVQMPKTASVVFLQGGRAYWDASASKVHFKKVNDRDFYLGRFAEDATSSATTCVVDLNVDPKYDLSLQDQGFLSVATGTKAAGGFGYPVRLGGTNIFELTSTSEAQCIDALSVDGFSVSANAIIEGAFRVLSDGAGSAVDVSMGIASGTSATDADAIAESCFIHLDANNTTINAESDDGVATEVAATDTTKVYVEGSAVANRVEFWMDMRDPADIQIYIDGVLVLGSTVFTLSAATGPEFLLVHVEKTSSADTYKLAVDWLRARFAQI